MVPRHRGLAELAGAFPRSAPEDVRALERSTWETHGGCDESYSERVRTLLLAAPDLVADGRADDLGLVACMDTAALRTPGEQAWYAARAAARDEAEAAIRDLQNFRLVDPGVARGPALLKCGRCGSEEVRYVSRQTRSADEGSTLFFTCQSCGHKWRQS